MHHKAHVLFISLCTYCGLSGTSLAAEAPSTWDDSPVGQCHSYYKKPASSEEYPIAVQFEKQRDRQNNRYVWTWDPTPSRNPTRQLVRVTPKNRACIVLWMPNADSHDFRLARHGALPAKVVASSAVMNNGEGGRVFEQEYDLDRASGFYQKVPTCYEVKLSGNDRRRIDCEAALQ